MYKLGETITVVKTSKMKLKPIKDINNAPATLVGLIPSKRFIKNNKQKIANTPVLITGTRIDTTIAPAKSLLYFLNGIITKPAITPAKVVFNKQVSTVPTGLMEKKTLIVLGENNVSKPDTKPKNPPTIGPYNIAPKAIIINEKFKLANPPGMTI